MSIEHKLYFDYLGILGESKKGNEANLKIASKFRKPSQFGIDVVIILKIEWSGRYGCSKRVDAVIDSTTATYMK